VVAVAESIPVVVERLRAAGCVFAEEEARLLVATATTPDDLDSMVARRVRGLPLEHVLGWAEFCGLRIVVDPHVFVPRRRTEFLVRQAEALLDGRAGRRRAVVVDLCCGSGALGVALSAAVGASVDPSVEVDLHAADLDPAAVRCARRNVVPAGGQVHSGDLYDALPGELCGRVDVLVANAPYVPTSQFPLLPAEARLHEARMALDGGEDGLLLVRRVIAGAPDWLAPGGHLLVETSERQVPAAVEALARAGLVARVASSEEYQATVVIGTSPYQGSRIRQRY